ncbi:MAG: hypothetical protein ACKV2T_33625 [Kofleriaceae bacterium]
MIRTFPQPEIELPAQRSFKLLQAGKDAAPLRYVLADRTASYAAITRLSSRRLAGAQASPYASLPPMTTTLAITTSGKATLVARPVVAEVETPTPESTQYLAGWNAIADRRVTIALDDRGQLGTLGFVDDPTGAKIRELDDLTQRLLAIAVPLPAEPVGVGGSWRVTTVLRQRPAIVKQTATYTLVERGDRSWKIDVEIQRVGEPQTVIDASVPAGTAIELVALVRKLRGTLVVDPAAPLGTGELAVDSSLHLRIRDPKLGEREEILEDTGTITLSVR